MTIYARIQDGIVAELWTAPGGLAPIDCFYQEIAEMFVECDDTVHQGYTYSSGVFAAPAQPPSDPPVPQVISDRQFFQQLAIQSLITQDEALAAVKVGALPAALATLVAELPVEQQFGANMLLCGATIFQRNHPLVVALAAAWGFNSAQTDALWTAAYAL